MQSRLRLCGQGYSPKESFKFALLRLILEVVLAEFMVDGLPSYAPLLDQSLKCISIIMYDYISIFVVFKEAGSHMKNELRIAECAQA